MILKRDTSGLQQTILQLRPRFVPKDVEWRQDGKIEECRAKTQIADMESRMLCFYYSLILYNEWIILRAMLSDGTERQSVMTVLTFKIQVESHLARKSEPPA